MDFQLTANHQSLLSSLQLAGGGTLPNLMLVGQPPKAWDAVVESGAQVLIQPSVGTLAEILQQLWQAAYTGPCYLILNPLSNLRSTLEIRLSSNGEVAEPPTSDWLVFLGQFAAPNWFLERPLHGLTVVNTRSEEQSASLTDRLAKAGAEVVPFPCLKFESIRDESLAQAFCRIEQYSWIVFTSSNGVDQALQALLDSGLDLRRLAGCKLATIGSGTAARLLEWNLVSDLTPPDFVAESLLESLLSVTQVGDRILLARAEEARDVLPDGLRAAGREVDVVPVYRTVSVIHEQSAIELARQSDWVVLASSSAARLYTQAIGGVVDEQKVLAIGPITEQTARELGWSQIETAKIHNQDGILESLLASVSAFCR